MGERRMMKERRKLLLCGANETLINEFFMQLSTLFEMLSCSTREEDISGHLNYYDPDALVLCMYNESRDDLFKFKHIRELLRERGSRLIIAGDGTKCDAFERMMPGIADFMARRGRINSCQVLGEQIDSYLNTMAGFRKSSRTNIQTETANAGIMEMGIPTPVMDAGGIGVGDSLDDILAAVDQAVKEMEALPVQRAPGERRHVLVVDDDSSMLRMIKDILGDHYDVAAAISGKVALKFLETRRTDLILLDYEMPEQSGAEVYEKILNNPALRHIPVVFLTGVSDRERIASVLALRPRGYLLKPIDSERLRKTVAEIVD